MFDYFETYVATYAHMCQPITHLQQHMTHMWQHMTQIVLHWPQINIHLNRNAKLRLFISTTMIILMVVHNYIRFFYPLQYSSW